jgi:heme/copper-type cytochrome/quinol oxidase subunit 2
MNQQPATLPHHRGSHTFSFWAFLYIGLMVGLLFCAAITFGTYFTLKAISGRNLVPVAHAAQIERHVHLNLNIVINQPGKQQDWPAYSPNNLVVPANSLVTINLHDYDLGDTAMPKNTPFGNVQGTVGKVAYLNGHAYSALASDKIAHTFTIQQLNINVPLPGDGKESDIISFTFQTGKAGTYYFRCFDPCGTGSIGWQGPMVTRGYMLGTLSVQG